MSADVTDYLFNRYQEKGVRYKLRVRVTSDEQIDTERLRSAFRRYFDSEQVKLKNEKRRNTLKQIWMFALGVLFIGLGLYAADKLPALPGEIISTIGAFSMWEAASIWIVENPGNRLRRRWIDTASQTEIVCETDSKQV